MAPTYKLTYFNIKGLAELSRFLLNYGKIDFEDDRIDKAKSWADIKPNMPFGQVPILTVAGRQYHQSIAIARFLAKKVGLAGKDELEDLEIDSIVDTINDLRQKITLFIQEQDPAVKESRKQTIFNETFPYYMTRFEKIAEENNGHLACKKLTWADMYFVTLLDSLNSRLNLDVISKFPNLKAVEKNVLEIPEIKKWMETRPKDAY